MNIFTYILKIPPSKRTIQWTKLFDTTLINHLIHCNLLTFTLSKQFLLYCGKSNPHSCVHSFLMLNHLLSLLSRIQLYMNTFRAQTICQIKENSAKIFSLEIDFLKKLSIFSFVEWLGWTGWFHLLGCFLEGPGIYINWPVAPSHFIMSSPWCHKES